MTRVISLCIALMSFYVASCALDPEVAAEELDGPVRINTDAIPKDVEEDAAEVATPALKPKSKLGFRTPDLVGSLPTESQTTGSAPLPPTVDDMVEDATTIRADE